MPISSHLAAVFFDLDETLIHSCEASAIPPCHEPSAAVYGPWAVWLRPSARSLLASARALRAPVLLCTTSEHRYALGISRLLNLGFQENEILACEHLGAGRSNLCPRGVLMDDLPAQHEAAALKRHVLGLAPERYFQVAAFRGGSLEPEPRLPELWRLFLRRMARKA